MTNSRPSRDSILSFPKGYALKQYELVDPPGKSRPNEKYANTLGAGGSGVVFLANQTLHGKIKVKRAIKFYFYRDDIAQLAKHRHTSPVATDDFLVEAANMSALSHEHVVAVVDAGLYTTRGVEIPYLVTEYVAGPTLQDIIGSCRV